MVGVIGLRGDVRFDVLADRLAKADVNAVILDPQQVYGKEMLLSAVEHAERAFAQGENSSKTLLTEIILYSSGERQISKAISKMRPKECSYVVVILDDCDDSIFGDLERDDSLIDGNEEKVRIMGLDPRYPDMSALERVAMVDVLKKVK